MRRILCFILIFSFSLAAESAPVAKRRTVSTSAKPSVKSKTPKRVTVVKAPSRVVEKTAQTSQALPVYPQGKVGRNFPALREPAPASIKAGIVTFAEIEASRKVSGRAKADSHSKSKANADLLESRGLKLQVNQEWNMRLSVDSRTPSTLSQRPEGNIMGLDTVGPTLTLERKF